MLLILLSIHPVAVVDSVTRTLDSLLTSVPDCWVGLGCLLLLDAQVNTYGSYICQKLHDVRQKTDIALRDYEALSMLHAPLAHCSQLTFRGKGDTRHQRLRQTPELLEKGWTRTCKLYTSVAHCTYSDMSKSMSPAWIRNWSKHNSRYNKYASDIQSLPPIVGSLQWH